MFYDYRRLQERRLLLFLSCKYKRRNAMKKIYMKHRRSGAVLAVAIISMVVLMGFMALVVDVGQLYLTKVQCDVAAHAGAKAGIVELSIPGTDAEDRARQMAALFVSRNPVGTGWGHIDPDNDEHVCPGRWEFNPVTNDVDFIPRAQPSNALRVRVPGPVYYTFGRILAVR
jgi:hypothetical protein